MNPERYSPTTRPHLRPSLSSRLYATILLAALTLTSTPQAKPREKLPEKYEKSPYSLMSLTVGAPNGGYQIRAKRLREAPQLQIKSGSGSRTYGHPALVLMLRRSAQDIAKASPNSVMLVGDLSAKAGGPISGHRSHQSGRDADIGFYVRNESGKQVLLRQFVKIDSQGNVLGRKGLYFDDWRNWLLVRSWLRDTRAGITHVFVASPIRQRLLEFARKQEAEARYVQAAVKLLKQPSNSARHDDHFHLRIACPQRQADICVKEAVSD